MTAQYTHPHTTLFGVRVRAATATIRSPWRNRGELCWFSGHGWAHIGSI